MYERHFGNIGRRITSAVLWAKTALDEDKAHYMDTGIDAGPVSYVRADAGTVRGFGRSIRCVRNREKGKRKSANLNLDYTKNTNQRKSLFLYHASTSFLAEPG
ncbi:hypothetical protein IJI76_01870 [Candidatus Saccharibacteria bacterium]|nr:hypothetical protein [Candidatus Saccharibacteria bacterium]